MLTKTELDQRQCAECGVPGCENPVVLMPKCHYGSPVVALYFDGVMTLKCCKCEGTVAEILVGEREIHRRYSLLARLPWIGRRWR